MNAYEKYIRYKTLKEFYENMSDEDRDMLLKMSGDRLQQKNEQPVTYVQCKDPYFRGVSQNIVGDGLYDIGIHLLKTLIRKVKL